MDDGEGDQGSVAPVDSISNVQSGASSLVSGRKRKRSWVWNYFIPDPDRPGRYLCKADHKDQTPGKKCNTSLIGDKTGSTGNMVNHLRKAHKLSDPAGNKAFAAAATGNGSFPASERTGNMALTTALAYTIIDCDLPISFCERESLVALLKVCNPNIGNLMVKRGAMSTHIRKMFAWYQDRVRDKFRGACNVSFTVDSWTLPNNNALMAITAHYLDQDFILHDFALGFREVKGQHSGANFADTFKIVLDDFQMGHGLMFITADNASTSVKLGREIENSRPSFKYEQRLLGCVADVINSAAKRGLAALGPWDVDDRDEEEINGVGRIPALTPEDGAGVNIVPIMKRLHDFVVHVTSSPQEEEIFESRIQMKQLYLYVTSGIRSVVLDVKTRWNSTFLMLERIVLLKETIVDFCDHNDYPRYKKYQLNSFEWEKVEQVISFLGPLHTATETLCSTKYPPLNSALVICTSLITRLNELRDGYDPTQLIPAVDAMINKLEEYLYKALLKPAYFIAVICDPRTKLKYFMLPKTRYILQKVMPGVVINAHYFRDMILELEPLLNEQHEALPSVSQAKQASSTSTAGQYLDDLDLSAEDGPLDLRGELDDYLREKLETKDVDVLLYWRSRKGSFPKLSQIARIFLGIPATSAASERVFSEGRKILDWQRALLFEDAVEELLSLKEWCKQFGQIFKELS